MIFVCTSNAGKTREFSSALKTFCPWVGPSGGVQGFADISPELLKGYNDPVEDADHFVGNGWKKLEAALQWWNKLEIRKPHAVLVDDSGLCVPKWDGRPGVHSATFAGLPRSDQRNRSQMACDVRLQGQTGLFGARESERRLPAYFVCSLLCLEQLGNGTDPYDAHDLAKRLRLEAWLSPEREKEHLKQLSRWPCDERLANVNEQVSGAATAIHLPGGCLHIVHAVSRGWVSDTEQNLLPGEGHGYDAIFYPLEDPARSFASISLEQKNGWSHRGAAVKVLAERLQPFPTPAPGIRHF